MCAKGAALNFQALIANYGELETSWSTIMKPKNLTGDPLGQVTTVIAARVSLK